MLSTVTMFFGMGFLDRYTWLRDAPALNVLLTTAGILMITTGGIFAAFQRHLARIMGYAIIVESGYSLLALAVGGANGAGVFLLLLIPRALSLGVWALALSVLRESAPSLDLAGIQGLGRSRPVVAGSLVLASLALAGMPLLAGFPSHQAIWEGLARTSSLLTFWAMIGSLGLFLSQLKTLASFAGVPVKIDASKPQEMRMQRLVLILGVLALFLIGLFPQWVLPLWTKLPAIFVHLGQ